MLDNTRYCYIKIYISCGPHGFRAEVFPIISLYELYVAMTTRVPIQLAPKVMQPFTLPGDDLHEI